MRVALQHFEIADAVVARAGLEGVMERQRRQRGVAAGAAAANDQPLWIRLPRRHHRLGAAHGVFDIDDAPLPFQPIAIRPAISRAAAVIHVEHRKPAAGPELDLRIEHIRRRAGGSAMGDHQQRRLARLAAAPHRDWSAGSKTRERRGPSP